MGKPLRLGIAGLGTVGGGVVMLLKEHADAHVAAGSAGTSSSSPSAPATATSSAPSYSQGVRMVDDPVALAGDDRIDVWSS